MTEKSYRNCFKKFFDRFKSNYLLVKQYRSRNNGCIRRRPYSQLMLNDLVSSVALYASFQEKPGVWVV